MRILIFYQYFGTPKGGWSTRIYEYSRRWVEQGHDVTVVTTLYDKSDLKAKGLFEKQQFSGIDVYVINIQLSNQHNITYRILSFFAYAIMATIIGIRVKSDIIIASSGPITVGIPALIVKWIRNKPMAFEVRDLWPDGAVAFGILKNKILKRIAYNFEYICYKNSSLIVAASKGMAQNIMRRFQNLNIVTIPNAADNELFRMSIKNEILVEKYLGKLIFVYTGTLGLIDDCMQIVMAANELYKRGRTDIKILFIGDGKERSDLEKRTHELNLDNIEFIGLISKNALVGYLQIARASILTVKPIPFMDDCSPNKIFDAFAAGVPIMQTTRGWIYDLVNDAKCGLNIPPNDPIAFADAIEALSDNSDLFSKCSKGSQKLADNDFNRNRLASLYLDEIKKLVD